MMNHVGYRAVLAVCRKTEAARFRGIGFERVPVRPSKSAVVLRHPTADSDLLFAVLCFSLGGMTLLAHIAKEGDNPAEVIACDGMRGIYLAVNEREHAIGYSPRTAKLASDVLARAKAALGLRPGTLISSLGSSLAGASALARL
jgi:hypothetical protein